MNIKRFFGALLTVLGIAALIYAATSFINTTDNVQSVKIVVIYSMVGLIFFISGIGLIRTTKDES
jgi:uncharacterized membrane protein